MSEKSLSSNKTYTFNIEYEGELLTYQLSLEKDRILLDCLLGKGVVKPLIEHYYKDYFNNTSENTSFAAESNIPVWTGICPLCRKKSKRYTLSTHWDILVCPPCKNEEK